MVAFLDRTGATGKAPSRAAVVASAVDARCVDWPPSMTRRVR